MYEKEPSLSAPAKVYRFGETLRVWEGGAPVLNSYGDTDAKCARNRYHTTLERKSRKRAPRANPHGRIHYERRVTLSKIPRFFLEGLAQLAKLRKTKLTSCRLKKTN